MIVLHRKENHPASDKLEEKLKTLVISFKTKNHGQAAGNLPYIEESGELIRGEKNIQNWLQQLESELNWQRSLSGDGCYIDPDSGKVC